MTDFRLISKVRPSECQHDKKTARDQPAQNAKTNQLYNEWKRRTDKDGSLILLLRIVATFDFADTGKFADAGTEAWNYGKED